MGGGVGAIGAGRRRGRAEESSLRRMSEKLQDALITPPLIGQDDEDGRNRLCGQVTEGQLMARDNSDKKKKTVIAEDTHSLLILSLLMRFLR